MNDGRVDEEAEYACSEEAREANRKRNGSSNDADRSPAVSRVTLTKSQASGVMRVESQREMYATSIDVTDI